MKIENRLTITLLLLIFTLFVRAQDYRIIDWPTNVENVISLNVDTFKFDAKPIDYNAPGALTREIGNYFIDYVARCFKIIDSDATTITVVDIEHINLAPQSNRIGLVERSIYEGDSLFFSISSTNISLLDNLSQWRVAARNNELFGQAIQSKVPETRKISINGDTLDLSEDRTWYITSGVSGYASNLYLSDSVSSTVSTYNKVSYINDITSHEQSKILNNNELLIKTYIYDIPIGISMIDAGTWTCHFYAKVSSPVLGVTRLKFEIFKRSAANVETTLFSSYSDPITNTIYDYINEIMSIQEDIILNPTDRLGVRVYGTTTSSANVAVYYGTGDNTSSYLNTPLRLRHSQLRIEDWGMAGHTGLANTFAAFNSEGHASYVGIDTMISKYDLDTLQQKLLDSIAASGGGGSSQWVDDANGITYTDGNIGVGVASNALAKISANGAVLFSGTYNSSSPANPPASGVGTRMMWYPDKAALRAGYVVDSRWDKANVGDYSTAFGYTTVASGESSSCFNVFGIASGTASSAFGYSTRARSYAETAIGSYSTDYTPTSATESIATDRLFVVGNGVGSGLRSNALTMLKNGKTGFGTEIPTEIIDVNGNIAADTIKAVLDTTYADKSDWQTFIGSGSGTGDITGTLTSNYIPVATGTKTIGNSSIYQDANGNIGINTTSITGKFTVNGSARVGNNIIRIDNIEVNTYGTGDRSAYIDLVGDDTYSDFGLRIVRGNGGVNAISNIIHRGTGSLRLISQDAGNIGLFTNNTQRLHITSAGNVGVGTSNPANLFEVNGYSVSRGGSFSRLEAQASDYWSLPSYLGTSINQYANGTSGSTAGLSWSGLGTLLFQNTSNALIYTNGSTPLILGTASTERIRIEGDGDVGIGTSTPAVKLHVAGQVQADTALLDVQLPTYGQVKSYLSRTSTGTGTGYWSASGDTIEPTRDIVRLDTVVMGNSYSSNATNVTYFSSGLKLYNGSSSTTLTNTDFYVMNETAVIRYRMYNTGSAYEIQRSFNSGTNWENVGLQVQGVSGGLSRINLKCSKYGDVVAVTDYNSTTNRLLVSRDYGTTWATSTIGTSLGGIAIEISDDGTLVAVGAVSNNIYIYRNSLTTQVAVAEGKYLYDIEVANDSTIYYTVGVSANPYAQSYVYKVSPNKTHTKILGGNAFDYCELFDYENGKIYINDANKLYVYTDLVTPDRTELYTYPYSYVRDVEASANGQYIYAVGFIDASNVRLYVSSNGGASFTYTIAATNSKALSINEGSSSSAVKYHYENGYIKFDEGGIAMHGSYVPKNAKDVVTKDWIEGVVGGGGDITGVLTPLNSFLTGGSSSGEVTLGVSTYNGTSQKTSVVANDRFLIGDSEVGGIPTKFIKASDMAAYFGGGSGMTWPSSAGIPYYNGSNAWGTSITSSLGLKNAISDETGSGALMFATSPTVSTSLNLRYSTASTLVGTDASKNLISLSTATYPSLAELSYVKGVTSAIQTQINGKQATLVSGTNIKTINGSSILGSGDLTISGSTGGTGSSSDKEFLFNNNGTVDGTSNLSWDESKLTLIVNSSMSSPVYMGDAFVIAGYGSGRSGTIDLDYVSFFISPLSYSTNVRNSQDITNNIALNANEYWSGTAFCTVFNETTDEYQIIEYHLFIKGNTSYNLTEKSRSGSPGLSASAVTVWLGPSAFAVYFSNFDSSVGDNIHSNIVLKGTRSTY